MNDLTGFIKEELLCHGADLVGVGDLTEFSPEKRWNMPVGIAVAVKYPKHVIRGIADMPTREYYDLYNELNAKLERLTSLGSQVLLSLGYKAIANKPTYMQESETFYKDIIPHKTVATRAGLGWIGKCALLVTREYGSAVRIAPVFTDAPLKTSKPVNASECADCSACMTACPAGAVSGKTWSPNLPRDEFFKANFCRKTARERSNKGFGIKITLCGRCIAVCPHTLRYINQN